MSGNGRPTLDTTGMTPGGAIGLQWLIDKMDYVLESQKEIKATLSHLAIWQRGIDNGHRDKAATQAANKRWWTILVAVAGTVVTAVVALVVALLRGGT